MAVSLTRIASILASSVLGCRGGPPLRFESDMSGGGGPRCDGDDVVESHSVSGVSHATFSDGSEPESPLKALT